MAQPLFDQHPLDQYFRDAGETAEPMPGGSPDFVFEDDSLDLGSPSDTDMPLPPFLLDLIQIVQELLPSSSHASNQNPFAERFKYDVISSSLLSSSLAASVSAPITPPRRLVTPELPGRLHEADGDDPPTSGTGSGRHSPEDASDSTSLPSQLPVVLLSIAVAVLSIGHYLLAFPLVAAAIYVRYVVHADSKSNYTTQTMDALNDLISAGNVWDSAVNEAIMLIENEEKSIFYGPTSLQAPSSSLRIALQSSLHTTQTQCDNVRQLLSALTSPATLSQLAEMYAPPSPIRHAFVISDPLSPSSPSTSLRPFSHPTGSWRPRPTSSPGSTADKRATWNGSYAALALAGSPTAHLAARKKQNRRSDVTSLFQSLPGSGPLASVSAPVTPQSPSPESKRLGVLQEEEHLDDEELEDKNYFGAAALDMQRKRKSAGLEVFGAPPPSYTPPRSPIRGAGVIGQPPTLISPTKLSSSRLTSVHTTRHPLSLSGLHLALQGALSSKRYACSYLLALRFSDDEDESYWENVRSVMALLSSTFSDASTRLVEALDEAEKRRIKDEHPTPPRGNTPTPQGKESSRDRCTSPLRNTFTPMRSMAEMTSFAPMPSNMTRLAGHIDAMSTALNDAREHIEECVASLRDPLSLGLPEGGLPSSVQDHPAFQAYDRLRKELGYALRECERGRERLLEIVAPRAPADTADDEDAAPHTPGLRQDSGSESSEKYPISPNVASGPGLGLSLSIGRDEHEHEHEELDDATAHLLLSSSTQHLPPAGAEQVFEAETGATGPFARPRSKLSREERIAIMKARRASGMGFVPSATGSASPIDDAGAGRVDALGRERERWGPGGEVVQELKDVIWKVGEKRRRMSLQVPGLAQAPTSPRARVELPLVEDAEAHGSPASEDAHMHDEGDAWHHAPGADHRLSALHIDVPHPGGSTCRPEPERETSISIAVDGGTPAGEIEEPDLAGTEISLDSPPPSPLPYSRRVLELEAALRTVPESPSVSSRSMDMS